MTFFVYRDTKRQWRWRLVAASGWIIASSADGYGQKADCLAAIAVVKESSAASVSDL